MDEPRTKNTLFGELVLVKRLGEGSYGTVNAFQLPDGSLVAIKTTQSINYVEGIDHSVLREVHALQSLRGCSNILQLINVAIDVHFDHTWTDLMVPYHINNLEHFYKQIGIRDRVMYFPTIFDQTITALKHLYDRSILHLDIKPQNILVDYVYDEDLKVVTLGPECYLADFGLSKQVSCMGADEDMQNDYDVMSPPYRPPEILLEQPYNNKADTWSMGMTLLEYLRASDMFTDSISFAILITILNRMQGLPSKVKDMIETSAGLRHALNQIESGELYVSGQLDLTSPRVLSTRIAQLVPKVYLDKLGQMLEFDQYLRISANDLAAFVVDMTDDTNIVCLDQEVMPARGTIVEGSSVNYAMALILYDRLAGVAKEEGYSIRLLVNTTDLIDRYIANYIVTRKGLQLLGIACMVIAETSNRNEPPDLTEWPQRSGDTYTMEEIKEYEALVFKRMNYMTSSCDMDIFVSVLNKDGATTDDLKMLYKKIRDTATVPGAFSYEELVDIYLSL